MLRSGDEPIHARSPLRMRRVLAVWGLLWTAGGAVAFALIGNTAWAVTCAALALIALVDLFVVGRRIRQGAHYQPGRDVPPYEPVHGTPPRRRRR
ncbi:DUF6343 family protein [Streptomyces sp. NPDC059506]|uniref:DUF6343 family protein n=1 Tax=Streptomyces thermolineatus TaxID=44033 RepID=A0ABN3L4J3_9ACTN|nr:DUF6343 family protein [Streptomyces sp. HB2AG]MCZ2526605.1 DUF6343 family protein [Streptomyces sp. HB2AG]